MHIYTVGERNTWVQSRASAHSVQKPSRVKPVMAIPSVEHVTSSSPYTFFLSVEPNTAARA